MCVPNGRFHSPFTHTNQTLFQTWWEKSHGERQRSKCTGTQRDFVWKQIQLSLCTKRFTVNLPAMTVLFPSSTTRGSLDSDESITLPSNSLPSTVKHAIWVVTLWHRDIKERKYCISTWLHFFFHVKMSDGGFLETLFLFLSSCPDFDMLL